MIFFQARKFDGDYIRYYHPECFFKKFQLKSESAADGFAKLRNGDQQHLRNYIKPQIADLNDSRKRKIIPDSHLDDDDISDFLQLKKLKFDSDEESEAKIADENAKFHELLEKIRRVNVSWQKEILRNNQQFIPRKKDHVGFFFF